MTFKEDCPDIRNTRVIDIARELRDYGLEVAIHDPVAHPDEVHHEYGENIESAMPAGGFAAVIVAVAHRQFKAIPVAEFRALCAQNGVLFDVKSILPRKDADDRL